MIVSVFLRSGVKRTLMTFTAVFLITSENPIVQSKCAETLCDAYSNKHVSNCL